MSTSIVAENGHGSKPLRGTPVQHGSCPACHQPRLRYRLETRALTCECCPWAVILTPAEHEDWLFLQIWPDGTCSAAGFLSAVAQRVHVVAVAPDPKVLTERDGAGVKLRLVPTGGETPEQRMLRLADQAALNGVQVLALNEELTTFKASSQRRNPGGQPVAWYSVHIGARDAQCSCLAQGSCAHLSAVHTWLLDYREWVGEREIGKPPAERQALGKAAYADLYGRR